MRNDPRVHGRVRKHYPVGSNVGVRLHEACLAYLRDQENTQDQDRDRFRPQSLRSDGKFCAVFVGGVMNIEKEKTAIKRLKPCPFCGDIWLFVSDGDYYSGYESFGYRVNCQCGFAWKAITWQKTKKEAIEAWNRRTKNEQIH